MSSPFGIFSAFVRGSSTPEEAELSKEVTELQRDLARLDAKKNIRKDIIGEMIHATWYVANKYF